MKLLCRLLSMIAGFVLAAHSVADAQDYPTRPITIVVPYTPAGSTDLMARLVGQKLEERFGKPVLIENRPGAGTAIASNAVAKSAPDGYTLLLATPTPMAINVALFKNLGYDPAADFIPLVLISRAPFVLIVNPSVPVNTVQDLIKFAKEKPGQLSYGSGGPGSPHHLYSELLKSMTGIQMTHVPYKGTVPALNDVIAGHIQVMFSDIPPAIGVVQTGKVRALGVSTTTRLAAFPNVPTIAEAGVPGFDVAGWFMLVAPARTPTPVITKLHGELKSIVATAAVKEQIAKLSLLPIETPSVADMQVFVKSEGQSSAAGRHRRFGITSFHHLLR
jgi:tripartite-type tricarboxylate transporter receptor subunit TctC